MQSIRDAIFRPHSTLFTTGRGSTSGRRFMTPCLSEIKTQKSPKNQPMKNGNSEHDFDSIAELLRPQNAAFEVLPHHLAYVEATVSTLLVKTLPHKDKADVRKPGLIFYEQK